MRKTLSLLCVSVIALLAIGLLLLASASWANCVRLHLPSHHFLLRQGIWIAVGAFGGVAAALFDYRKLREVPWLTVSMYLVVSALLVAVLFAPETKGSHRWIALGPINLQPSELGKLIAVVALAAFIDARGWKIERFWVGAVPAAGIVGVLAALMVKEPDFGSTMVVAATAATLFFIGGVRIVHMIALGAIGAAGVLPVLASNHNRMRRIVAWLPQDAAAWVVQALHLPASVANEEASDDARHQLNAALVAIRKGGLLGVGFNKSMQKQFYLPEAHTDFIFAIGAEEWGLGLSLALLALFSTVFACGVRIALKAPDRFGRLLAFGATFVLFFQALFNMGVVTGCLPTKGLALPFISYGGTNMIVALVSVGLLVSVGRRIELPTNRLKSTISRVYFT